MKRMQVKINPTCLTGFIFTKQTKAIQCRRVFQSKSQFYINYVACRTFFLNILYKNLPKEKKKENSVLSP